MAIRWKKRKYEDYEKHYIGKNGENYSYNFFNPHLKKYYEIYPVPQGHSAVEKKPELYGQWTGTVHHIDTMDEHWDGRELGFFLNAKLAKTALEEIIREDVKKIIVKLNKILED